MNDKNTPKDLLYIEVRYFNNSIHKAQTFDQPEKKQANTFNALIPIQYR